MDFIAVNMQKLCAASEYNFSLPDLEGLSCKPNGQGGAMIRSAEFFAVCWPIQPLFNQDLPEFSILRLIIPGISWKQSKLSTSVLDTVLFAAMFLSGEQVVLSGNLVNDRFEFVFPADYAQKYNARNSSGHWHPTCLKGIHAVAAGNQVNKVAII